jgi:hypothetical protein
VLFNVYHVALVYIDFFITPFGLPLCLIYLQCPSLLLGTGHNKPYKVPLSCAVCSFTSFNMFYFHNLSTIANSCPPLGVLIMRLYHEALSNIKWWQLFKILIFFLTKLWYIWTKTDLKAADTGLHMSQSFPLHFKCCFNDSNITHQ